MKIQKSTQFLVFALAATLPFSVVSRADDMAAPSTGDLPADAAPNPYGGAADAGAPADTAPVAPMDPNSGGMGSIGEDSQSAPAEEMAPAEKPVKKSAKKRVSKGKNKKKNAHKKKKKSAKNSKQKNKNKKKKRRAA